MIYVVGKLEPRTAVHRNTVAALFITVLHCTVQKFWFLVWGAFAAEHIHQWIHGKIYPLLDQLYYYLVCK
jgi:hypothetical protein